MVHDGSRNSSALPANDEGAGRRVGRLMTVAEVAEMLGTCNATVYRAVWRGQLVATRIGRSTRIAVSDLRSYLAARRDLPPRGQ